MAPPSDEHSSVVSHLLGKNQAGFPLDYLRARKMVRDAYVEATIKLFLWVGLNTPNDKNGTDRCRIEGKGI